MKIPLSKIVGRPVVQQTPNGPVCIGYEFLAALQRLAADPLPVKERYALARTIEDAERWVKSWEARRADLIKCHSITRKEYLQERAAGLKKDIQIAEGLAEVGDKVKHPALPRWRESLARIETELASGENADALVFPHDEARKVFEVELSEETQSEAELFLDHKIKLPEDSKLTGGEMAVLIDLVEVA